MAPRTPKTEKVSAVKEEELVTPEPQEAAAMAEEELDALLNSIERVLSPRQKQATTVLGVRPADYGHLLYEQFIILLDSRVLLLEAFRATHGGEPWATRKQRAKVMEIYPGEYAAEDFVLNMDGKVL
ncbi:hypothetical protein N2152v2_003192 [Parachlorella kessleri]